MSEDFLVGLRMVLLSKKTEYVRFLKNYEELHRYEIICTDRWFGVEDERTVQVLFCSAMSHTEGGKRIIHFLYFSLCSNNNGIVQSCSLFENAC